MKIFGIQTKQPTSKDIFIVGVTTLLGLLLILPLSPIVQPQTILAWTLAGAMGSLLAAMGITARSGGKHLVVIIFFSLIAAVIGHFVGVALLGIIKS